MARQPVYPPAIEDAKKIIHIDADCFYAAIEMRDNPALKDIPFAVGGSSTGRGVLTTCNYPARAFGIRSAMPTSHALRLCPDLQVGPVNMEKYREVSRGMHAIFHRYTTFIEPLSLDEAYLDVSDNEKFGGSATRVAEAIRQDVARELEITVSAGVSVNKFIAKVASDWQKPDGITVIAPEDVDQFSAALPVKHVPGVGRVTAGKLNAMGLQTCADIRKLEPIKLAQLFGKFGLTLHERAHGRDDRLVNPNRERKSVSVETTFATDVANGKDCLEPLPKLLDDLEARIMRADVAERVQKAFVKIKFNDFSTTTVEKMGTRLIEDDYKLLLLEGLERKALPVRLMGLGVRLTPEQKDQLTLDMEA